MEVQAKPDDQGAGNMLGGHGRLDDHTGDIADIGTGFIGRPILDLAELLSLCLSTDCVKCFLLPFSALSDPPPAGDPGFPVVVDCRSVLWSVDGPLVEVDETSCWSIGLDVKIGLGFP